jgi:dienelactone hydrolase
MRFLVAGLLGAVLAAFAPAARAQLPEAERFVDTPHFSSPVLSPNGNFVAVIQHMSDRHVVLVRDFAGGRTRRVQEIEDGVGQFNWVAWKGDDHLVMSASAEIDRTNRWITRIFAMNREGGNAVQMFEGQPNALMGANVLLDDLPNDPTHVMLMTWSISGGGAWRADITTGRTEQVADGTLATRSYATDGMGYPVMRLDSLHMGSGYRIMRRASGSRDWTFVLEARGTALATNSPDFAPVAPGPEANQVYVFARPDDRDLGALYLYNTATGDLGAPLSESATADAVGPWINAHTRELLATCEFAQRVTCRARDPVMQRHLNALDRYFERNATITPVSISADSSKWLIMAEAPSDGAAYYLYDRVAVSVEPLVGIYPNLEGVTLSPTTVENYAARDGTALWAYVTAPAGGAGPRPMVVMPHGGPESRDFYGFDSYAQFLASRGYVVLQPNFRGSLGFGRAFGDAGRGQWGRRMQDDVTDAVRHMIETGAADPQRICIVGASYGGYAALAGAALTPDLYRCAISVAGPSDLIEFLRGERESGRSSSGFNYWSRSIGDPNDDRDALIAVSPRQQAARIQIPVLLMHGEVDYTVPIRQSEIMERAFRDAGKTTRLVRFPGEGHIWNLWTRGHRLQLYQETERFLVEHLGPAQ